jgi:serine/threonine protein phosphatase PrpC
VSTEDVDVNAEDVNVRTQAGPSCPSCGAPLQAEDRFCERCGARVDDEGSTEAAETRVELDLTIAAAVSDQGLHHHRNEDSFHLAVTGERNVAVVVCDGISSASAGNVAARNAAQAAGVVLDKSVADPDKDASQAILDAIQAAVDAVIQVEWTTRVKRVDPSCTLVSAVCRGGEITVGWVGDSRAYWFDREEAHQLTVDDSFAEEGIAKGLLTPEQAAKSPFLHSITNWVGPDAPERPPRTVTLRPERPGRLVLCTDGLWNYAPSASELGGLIDALPRGAAPAAVARALADMANDRGGHDNITVAVIDIDP